MRMVEEFSFPEQAIQKVLGDDAARTIMVIGVSDTGKTTLVRELAKSFTSKHKTAILDIDPGQSNIGPPTTVAWAQVEDGFSGWNELKMQGFYFVGDTSPRGNLLPLTVGARLMWEEASSACERVIIDTTGLVRGGIGRALKLYLIEILRPEVVFAICKQDELDHILVPLQTLRVPRVLKLPASSQVKDKHFPQRRSHRELKFKEYFDRAREVEFFLSDVGLGDFFYSQRIFSLLVSLRDENNKDMSLGIIKDFSRTRQTVTIYSPVANPQMVRRVILGRLKLTPEGVQITTGRFVK